MTEPAATPAAPLLPWMEAAAAEWLAPSREAASHLDALAGRADEPHYAAMLLKQDELAALIAKHAPAPAAEGCETCRGIEALIAEKPGESILIRTSDDGVRVCAWNSRAGLVSAQFDAPTLAAAVRAATAGGKG